MTKTAGERCIEGLGLGFAATIMSWLGLTIGVYLTLAVWPRGPNPTTFESVEIIAGWSAPLLLGILASLVWRRPWLLAGCVLGPLSFGLLGLIELHKNSFHVEAPGVRDRPVETGPLKVIEWGRSLNGDEEQLALIQLLLTTKAAAYVQFTNRTEPWHRIDVAPASTCPLLENQEAELNAALIGLGVVDVCLRVTRTDARPADALVLEEIYWGSPGTTAQVVRRESGKEAVLTQWSNGYVYPGIFPNGIRLLWMGRPAGVPFTWVEFVNGALGYKLNGVLQNQVAPRQRVDVLTDHILSGPSDAMRDSSVHQFMRFVEGVGPGFFGDWKPLANPSQADNDARLAAIKRIPSLVAAVDDRLIYPLLEDVEKMPDADQALLRSELAARKAELCGRSLTPDNRELLEAAMGEGCAP